MEMCGLARDCAEVRMERVFLESSERAFPEGNSWKTAGVYGDFVFLCILSTAASEMAREMPYLTQDKRSA